MSEWIRSAEAQFPRRKTPPFRLWLTQSFDKTDVLTGDHDEQDGDDDFGKILNFDDAEKS